MRVNLRLKRLGPVSEYGWPLLHLFLLDDSLLLLGQPYTKPSHGAPPCVPTRSRRTSLMAVTAKAELDAWYAARALVSQEDKRAARRAAKKAKKAAVDPGGAGS